MRSPLAYNQLGHLGYASMEKKKVKKRCLSMKNNYRRYKRHRFIPVKVGTAATRDIEKFVNVVTFLI